MRAKNSTLQLLICLVLLSAVVIGCRRGANPTAQPGQPVQPPPAAGQEQTPPTNTPPAGSDNPTQPETFTVCPDDVRVCPDGSTVSRQLPSCQFPSCPVNPQVQHQQQTQIYRVE